jgi:hypothetical protein
MLHVIHHSPHLLQNEIQTSAVSLNPADVIKTYKNVKVIKKRVWPGFRPDTYTLY